MKHLPTFTKTCWAVILVAAIGFETYGCSESVSISDEVDVPLNSLTVTPGTLQPTFFRNTTSYTVNVPTGAATVTVTAAPKDSTALITIDGTITTQRSISLGAPGSTKTILITVESQNGLRTTYTVIVTRLLSSDNDLSALSVKVGNTAQPLVPSFDANNPDYTVNVANTVGQVSVVATKSDKDASMVISSEAGSTTVGPGVNPGQLLVTLGGPGTAAQVSIEVTAPNGSKKTYHVNVNRLSGDNNLKALTVSPGTLNIPFDPAITNYTVDVAYTVEQVTLSATKSDRNSAMSGSLNAGSGTPTDTKTLGLGGHGTSTDFLITVAATDPNVPTKTYKITVNRAAPSSNNHLDTLTVTPGSMNPAFAPSTVDYTVDVATNDNSVTVTATLQDANATMLINGQGTSSGQPREITPLQPPGNNTPITIVVRAQNEAEKPYTVTVRRPLSSSDDKLKALSVVPGTLDPAFDANVPAYTIIDIPPDNPTVSVTATKSDVNAVMLIGSEIVPAGVETGQVSVQVGISATVTIVVTAQNGVDSETYTITVP